LSRVVVVATTAVAAIAVALAIALSGGDGDSDSSTSGGSLVLDPEERRNAAEVTVVRSFLDAMTRGDCDAALAMMSRRFLDAMTARDNSHRAAGQSANSKEVLCGVLSSYRTRLEKGLRVDTVERTFVEPARSSVDVVFVDTDGATDRKVFISVFEDGRWKIDFHDLSI
jgi:hypothetical protein